MSYKMLKDEQFWDLIRDRYDSVIVNALMKLNITNEQKQIILDELKYWE